MFVLGIDPGLSRCGYGCVEHGRTPRAVAAGVIRTDPALDLPHRLAEVQLELRALIAELRPDVVAIERVLFQHNVSTAMGVGMASGLAMAEAVAAGCDVVEYSPNETGTYYVVLYLRELEAGKTEGEVAMAVVYR